MINNKPFKVRYFSAKDKMTITRNALWTDKCKYWTSKANRMLMTYFDVDKNALDVHDRFRHLLTITVSIGQVEA